jgi:methylenetetrahydrofolate dehydrogenase (NADP+)/methenyltetrahydrofolate cyclohydrolase
METKILDGAKYRDYIFNEIKNDISDVKAKLNKTPGIAFIACVGHQPLMKYTIGLHDQAARELGFITTIEILPHSATEEELIEIIEKLNHINTIHAIVLLQPMPKQLNAIRIIERIDKDKEVEGFHPQNVLETLTKGVYNTKYPMCLPVAVLELFENANVQVQKGQEFVFVADQDFISNPFRSLILRTATSQVVPPDCSLTIVNSDNAKIKDFCKKADFLFVISENPEFLQPEWLKPGVCIVDIYSNLIKEVPSKKNPDTLIPVIRGGVNTEAVMNIVGKIAPCPGGLMPILLAILFRNAFIAFNDTLNAKM